MEAPPKPKRVQKFGEYSGPTKPIYKGVPPSHLGHQAQMTENRANVKEAQSGPLRVPLFSNTEIDGTSSRKLLAKAIADQALRLFQIRPRGFRMLKDGTVPFLQSRMITAGYITAEDSKPERSQRSKNKRAAYGRHLLAIQKNPKQNWSNWQRNHNGLTREQSFAAHA